ncbi:MAG TPA: hypothetical protein DD730_06685 [Desulfosporosinus sp.]|nr:hypothetical protein [Desulfosporosinus sp.]
MKKIAYLLSIGFILTLLGCGSAINETSDPVAASSALLPAPPLSSKNQPEISMDEFNLIKNGMTYEQVTSIIGSPGEMVSETGTPGSQFYTAKYHFKGDGGLWSANAELMFKDGKLNSKTQKGLKKPASPSM